MPAGFPQNLSERLLRKKATATVLQVLGILARVTELPASLLQDLYHRGIARSSASVARRFWRFLRVPLYHVQETQIVSLLPRLLP